MRLSQCVAELEKENAELKQQLEIRQKWANTNFEIVLAAEKIVQKLKETYPKQEMIKAILSEAVYQVEKLDS